MKIGKNGDFRHISGIFSRKKVFLKNRTQPYLDIINTHCCAINQKKTNDEISRKSLKTGFPRIFPAFLAGKKSLFGHCHFAPL